MARRSIDPPDPRRLLALLDAGDIDAAIDAGLMRFAPVGDALGDGDVATLLQAQQRLREAWAARDRYRARAERLARRQAERDARRTAPPAASARPQLPAAAAAALARAKAKASGPGRA
jgi:hypothetical protein